MLLTDTTRVLASLTIPVVNSSIKDEMKPSSQNDHLFIFGEKFLFVIGRFKHSFLVIENQGNIYSIVLYTKIQW